MENEISPEQKAHLETWAGKRDAILLEISNLQTEKDKLEEKNRNLVTSYSDIEARANQTIGRLAEMEKKEAELVALTSKEVADLKSQKAVLEEEVAKFSQSIKVLSEYKASLQEDVALALANFKILKDEALVLDKVVDHVTRVSVDNTKKIDDLVVGLAHSLEEIIAVNKKNVFETNVVIEKLPAMLMEAQKHGLIKNKI